MGRLWEISSGGSVTRLLYDGDELIAEYDGAGALLRTYVHGAGIDDPILWFEAGVGQTRRLLADALGSIVAVSDQPGNGFAVNRYDEYGVPAPTNVGRFQYTGQAWFAELGLYYYKARFYNPALGRFMQTDPVGYDDQINLYAYVGNDPVNGRDPSGNCRDRDGEGECIVNNTAGDEGTSTAAALQAQVRLVDRAIQALDRRARISITTKDGETRVVTGAQLQREWRRTSWTIVPNSETMDNGYGAEMDDGRFRSTSEYLNSFVDRAQGYGLDRDVAIRSIVLHDLTHITRPGERIEENFPVPRGMGEGYADFNERERRTSQGAAVIAESIGVSFECRTFRLRCGP